MDQALNTASGKVVGDCCFYCGCNWERLEIDHVVPVLRGGWSRGENVVVACHTCNKSKWGKFPSEWRSDLRPAVYRLELKIRNESTGLRMSWADFERLANESGCAKNTVKSYLGGGPVQGSKAIAIETAARALGIELPAPKKRGRG